MAQEPSRTGLILMINGGSSSGKTTLSRRLQASLPGSWLLVGVDLFLSMLLEGPDGDPVGMVIEDGVVATGPDIKRHFASFQAAVAALARAGSDVIVDEVLLNGGADQRVWESALSGLDAHWVGVRCAPDIAEAREAKRGDRVLGMARLQAESVHRGVRYDVEVDTGSDSAADPVAVILASLPEAQAGRD